jgi:hypothetical protein
MNKYYVGDVGTEVVLDCGCDIAAATSPKIYVKKPDGTIVTWTAVVHTLASLTQYLRYYTVTGDLNQAGKYLLQAGLTMTGWTGRGETADFDVFAVYE